MSLVRIDPEEFGLELDLRYGSTNNFTGAPVYQKQICYLHEVAAAKMKKAVELARPLGLTFKIFDAFRPLEAQQALWNHTPDETFLSHPERGSRPHCRGVAVDLTLVKDGVELDMGTEFDAFTPLSFHANQEVSLEVQQNRFVLMGIMTAAGWDHFMNEWWHYQLFDSRSYPICTDSDVAEGIM